MDVETWGTYPPLFTHLCVNCTIAAYIVALFLVRVPPEDMWRFILQQHLEVSIFKRHVSLA